MNNIIITGSNLVPDCSGEYYCNGSIEEKSTYTNDHYWVSWNEITDKWVLQCYTTGEIWVRYDVDICGVYEPEDNYPASAPQGYPMISMVESSSSSSDMSD